MFVGPGVRLGPGWFDSDVGRLSGATRTLPREPFIKWPLSTRSWIISSSIRDTSSILFLFVPGSSSAGGVRRFAAESGAGDSRSPFGELDFSLGPEGGVSIVS